MSWQVYRNTSALRSRLEGRIRSCEIVCARGLGIREGGLRVREDPCGVVLLARFSRVALARDNLQTLRSQILFSFMIWGKSVTTMKLIEVLATCFSCALQHERVSLVWTPFNDARLFEISILAQNLFVLNWPAIKAICCAAWKAGMLAPPALTVLKFWSILWYGSSRN